MAKNSAIEWTDNTFNPWWGCHRVSPACDRCYAAAFSKRVGSVGWDSGAFRTFGDKHWSEPLKWDRKARAADPFLVDRADAGEHADPASGSCRDLMGDPRRGNRTWCSSDPA